MGIFFKIFVSKLIGDFVNRAALVGLPDIEQFDHPGRVAHDAQIAVEEQGGNIGGGQQVLKVVRQAAEFVYFVLVFLVNGGEFLVHRLQLFLAGFKLFKCGAQLFVCRLKFFIRGFHLLAAGFIFFDDGLQALPGFLKLVFELRNSFMLYLTVRILLLHGFCFCMFIVLLKDQ